MSIRNHILSAVVIDYLVIQGRDKLKQFCYKMNYEMNFDEKE